MYLLYVVSNSSARCEIPLAEETFSQKKKKTNIFGLKELLAVRVFWFVFIDVDAK